MEFANIYRWDLAFCQLFEVNDPVVNLKMSDFTSCHGLSNENQSWSVWLHELMMADGLIWEEDTGSVLKHLAQSLRASHEQFVKCNTAMDCWFKCNIVLISVGDKLKGNSE